MVRTRNVNHQVAHASAGAPWTKSAFPTPHAPAATTRSTVWGWGWRRAIATLAAVSSSGAARSSHCASGAMPRSRQSAPSPEARGAASESAEPNAIARSSEITVPRNPPVISAPWNAAEAGTERGKPTRASPPLTPAASDAAPSRRSAMRAARRPGLTPSPTHGAPGHSCARVPRGDPTRPRRRPRRRGRAPGRARLSLRRR